MRLFIGTEKLDVLLSVSSLIQKKSDNLFGFDKEERLSMKVFFILTDFSSRNKDAISLISAFVNIESIGQAADLLEALEIIRQRHPNAPIYNSNIYSENKQYLFTSLLNEGRSIVILPENYSVRGKCKYIGVNIDFDDLIDFDWIINSIGQILHENRAKGAKSFIQE